VYDDYGHHPTEVKATISAAISNRKYLEAGSRLFVMFQPHRYTRTADLMEEFSVSFEGVDSLILLDIYPAGERPIQGITSDVLCDRIKKNSRVDVIYKPDREDAINHLVSVMKSADILLTLGAGDVWKLGEKALERLNAA
jgi:UDP-N-acetylmuramate--alanine ligase